MVSKVIVILVMIVILFSLGSGLLFLVRDKGTGNRTVKALTWRIGLSICLFIALLIGFSLGLIQPHNV